MKGSTATERARKNTEYRALRGRTPSATPPFILSPVQAKQLRLTGLDKKIIVDLFAGGGGMSVAMEMAWGRSPDIAINHNDDALSLHRINHPQTRHYVADVFEVDPLTATRGRPVGWLHLSPDCTHFSQAKGGQPRSAKIRGLAWVGIRWAGQVRPDWISLENVKQFVQWGPLIAKRDRATGRVVKLDGSVAAAGERVPVQEQFLVPDPRHKGRTYRRWCAMLRSMGYDLESRNLVAADQGGHTTRERHFELGNCGGEVIQWDETSHYKNPKAGQKKWRAAADCIDWTIPCPSIFTRKRPLADATLRRIARGIQRYVLESGDPFIVPVTHRGADRVHDVQEPFRTVTTAHRGEFMLAAPTLVQAAHGEGKGKTKRWGSGAHDIKGPVGVIHAGGGSFALASAYLMQANGGYNVTLGRDLRDPMTTVTNTGSQQQLVTAILAGVGGRAGQSEPRGIGEPVQTVTAKADTALVSAHLLRQFGNSVGQSVDDPAPTVMASGAGKTAVVECTLSPDQAAGAERVAAFLMRYYGEGGQWSDLRDPMTTITTKDRMALVTVSIRGTPYVIVDIGLRMLDPRELFRAQDFPDSYIIDRGHDGRRFTKSAQVRMVGNSVDPLTAVGFLRLNGSHLAVQRKVA